MKSIAKDQLVSIYKFYRKETDHNEVQGSFKVDEFSLKLRHLFWTSLVNLVPQKGVQLASVVIYLCQ